MGMSHNVSTLKNIEGLSSYHSAKFYVPQFPIELMQICTVEILRATRPLHLFYKLIYKGNIICNGPLNLSNGLIIGLHRSRKEEESNKVVKPI